MRDQCDDAGAALRTLAHGRVGTACTVAHGSVGTAVADAHGSVGTAWEFAHGSVGTRFAESASALTTSVSNGDVGPFAQAERLAASMSRAATVVRGRSDVMAVS